MEAFDPSFYSANSNAMVALIKMVPDITPTQVSHHWPHVKQIRPDTTHPCSTIIHCSLFTRLVVSTLLSALQTLHLLACLGRGLSRHPPPQDQRLPLLNETWRMVTKAGPELLSEYVACTAAWMGLASAAYGTREVCIMLTDLGRHMDAALAASGGVGGMEGLLDTPMAQEALESIMATILGLMRREGEAVAALLTSEATMKVRRFRHFN